MGSSLSELERFFGERVTPEMAALVQRMPLKQIGLLSEHLLRRDWSLVERNANWRDPERSALPPPRLATACDELIAPTTLVPLSHSTTLKMLLMYSPAVLVADPIRAWANDVFFRPTDQHRQHLAAVLRGIEPVAPLVRAGHIELIPEEIPLVERRFGGQYLQSSPRRALHLSWDPVLAPLVLKLLPVEDWELAARGLDLSNPEDVSEAAYWLLGEHVAGADLGGELDPAFMEDLMQEYGSPDVDVVATAMTMRELLEYAALGSILPVTCQAASLGYLRRLVPSFPDGRLPHPVRFGVPPLGNVSWKDLVTLRRNEEVFDEFRTVLWVLVLEATAEAGNDADAFPLAVARLAQEVLGPTVASLQRRTRRDRALRRLVGKTIGASASIALSGLLLPARPGIEKAWERLSAAGGGAIGSQAERKLAEQAEARLVARNVLMTLL